MPTPEETEIVERILKAAHVASVTTRAKSALHSRPLAVLGDTFDGRLWFFTGHPSDKTAEIERHSEVNVSVGDQKGWLSFSGTASITRDPALIDRFWNPWAEAYFEGGREDPALALLEVDVDTIEYWDIDKPAIARAFEVVKAIVTKSAPDVGDSGTITT